MTRASASRGSPHMRGLAHDLQRAGDILREQERSNSANRLRYFIRRWIQTKICIITRLASDPAPTALRLNASHSWVTQKFYVIGAPRYEAASRKTPLF